MWTNPSLLEYLRWFRISDFSLTGSCEFLQVGESLVRVCHRSASACVFRLLSVGIPSADSRPELCGTDTHRSRCVGCNRNLFLFGFSNRILGSHSPPSDRLFDPSPTTRARSRILLLCAHLPRRSIGELLTTVERTNEP